MAENLIFQKPILVYIPCYNCADKIVQTISEIPPELHDQMECLILDNDSSDGTSDIVLRFIKEKSLSFKVNVIRANENLGYAGSQKLAYTLAINSKNVKKVIMLHGDGQYPPALLRAFVPYFNSDVDLINGYRSKKHYPKEEETPILTYAIIKCLSALESFVLWISQKEWHSGFVMFDRSFLQKIPLHQLSTWMHIDGEFLMCAAVLGAKTESVPIYKRYKKFESFGGVGRLKHILIVFRLMGRYRCGYYHKILKLAQQTEIFYNYTTLNARQNDVLQNNQ